MHVHHAPWSRYFTTFCFRGAFAYELQVGPLVIQRFYQPLDHAGHGLKVGRWLFWRDRYARGAFASAAAFLRHARRVNEQGGE